MNPSNVIKHKDSIKNLIGLIQRKPKAKKTNIYEKLKLIEDNNSIFKYIVNIIVTKWV